MSELTKQKMLENLRAYAFTPDDDTVLIKTKIRDKLLKCPELLYALNDKELEKELFEPDGTLKEDGEWDLYFGDKSHIRPYLYIPQSQERVNNFVCYQVSFDTLPRYDQTEKNILITFTIFVHGENAIDKNTGIPRHDLIASIIRENIAWGDITVARAVPVADKENITDNNYMVRTMVYQAVVPNSLVTSEKVGNEYLTYFTNKGKH